MWANGRCFCAFRRPVQLDILISLIDLWLYNPFLIGKLERVRVNVYVDEPDLGRVTRGLPVSIAWDALPGRSWKGEVDKTPTQVEALGSRQVGQVICVIENPNRDLLPGTNVTLSNAGAPDSTLAAIVVLFVAAVVIVGPSFALLFSLHGRRLLHADEADAVPATAPAHQAQPPTGSPTPAVSPAARAAVLALVVADAFVRALARRRGR